MVKVVFRDKEWELRAGMTVGVGVGSGVFVGGTGVTVTTGTSGVNVAVGHRHSSPTAHSKVLARKG